MYKILLVDDERIILDGISNFIDWSSLGTELVGTAKNGLQAWELTKKLEPDMIITDIKMPGMDGLELVETVHQSYPHIKFIMLSGFSEFNFAKQAMQFGVKHYLLKPCNENQIIEAIHELMVELEVEKKQNHFVQSMKKKLEAVLPYAREQLLKEFVTSNTFGVDDYQRFFQLNMAETNVQILLFQIEGRYDYEHMFAIRNIAEHTFKNTIFSCTIQDYVLIMIEVEEPVYERILEQIEQIRKTFYSYYQLDTTVGLSAMEKIDQARQLYKQALQCIQHRFYLGEGSIITKSDISSPVKQYIEFEYDEQKFCLLVKAGRWQDVSRELEYFFEQLSKQRMDIQTTKSYVIQLFNTMIRTANPKQMNDYLDNLSILLEMDTMKGMHHFFKEIAKEMTLKFYQQNRNKHSAIVQRILKIIEEEIGNKELSLHSIANDHLFMNADYVGKLFRKEMNERFSNYVTKVKMEKAIEMIRVSDDVRIFEVAEKLGYADAQYFSQVFKRYTGFAPTEFLEEEMVE